MQKLSMLAGNVFSGVPLDRVDHLRTDTAWIEARLNDPASRFVPVWNQQSIVFAGAEPRAALNDRQSIAELLDSNAPLAFLGVTPDDGGIAHFAVDFSHLPEETLTARYTGGALMDLRDSVQLVPAHEASILAYARGLMYWHRKNGFCAACGHKSETRRAGHERVCTNPACGAVHFPRTDSAVIVLVHDGDDCLLCRQSHWPTGMHSTLAGFLEPGESLEEAVAREIFEESGVQVADVRYHSSQPWPFPASIMVGFMAKANSREINVDDKELEYAHWYGRDWLRNVVDSDDFRMPGKYSIARRLIGDWIDGNFQV
ncbi:MAG TPA: NAD(+) diphosphatase [Alphaproteobacteria bacterium]|nr:NAD(+) diphosphatase [Pseudomonadota bacterium]HIM45665.1 NAD(+) diphosphatase [Alphaproteobacteria bacterium]